MVWYIWLDHVLYSTYGQIIYGMGYMVLWLNHVWYGTYGIIVKSYMVQYMLSDMAVILQITNLNILFILKLVDSPL